MIDIEKFICSLLADHPIGVTVREDIHKALKDQGLEYKGGKIVPIEDKTELKESEDERIIHWIRKELEDKYVTDNIVNNEMADKALAWLEKQGDKKDKLIKEIGEYKVKYTQEVLGKYMSNKDDERLRKTTIAFLKEFANKGYENAVECIDWVEKQGEQIDLANKEYWRGYREGKQEILDKYSELEKQGEKGTNGNEREIPNSDWSEEDEKTFSRICGIIHHAAYENYDVDEDGEELGEYARIINWFKSLKDRYTWKPSKEQLSYLSWIANVRLGDGVVEQEVSKHLNELYEDLKKLRKE